MFQKVLLTLTIVGVSGAFAAAVAPARGDFPWQNLAGEYKLVLSSCFNTNASSRDPLQGFHPISEDLKISVVDTDQATVVDKGGDAAKPEKGLLIEGQIDGVANSALVARIGAPAFSKAISFLEQERRVCDHVTRTNEAFATNLGIFGYIAQSHRNCQNDDRVDSLTESVQLSQATDTFFNTTSLTLIVERDITQETHQGFECHHKKVK